MGIDIGASSVKVAAVDAGGTVLRVIRRAHKGSPLPCLRAMLAELADGSADRSLSLSAQACGGVVATGSGADMLRALVPGLRVLEEVPALVKGVRALAPQAASVIGMGAQSGVFATGFAHGSAPEFAMNESCAAGTGSFFEDQMQRLGLPLESYSDLVARAQSVPRLSGRCSVFAKTDIIHRQQEGVPVEDILQGLCHATVKAFKATIVRNLPVEKPVALAGGVLENAGVVRAVREVFDLAEGELLADEKLVCAQAVGAALAAAEGAGGRDGERIAAGAASDASAGLASLASLRSALEGTQAAQADDLPRLPQLPQVDCVPNCGFALAPSPWNPQGSPAREGGAVPRSAVVDALEQGAPVPVALGVDVGSTSTNLVLASTDGVLLDAQYLRTRGNPKQAVRDGLASLAQRVGDRACVVAAGVTGSGRTMIGKLIGADAVRDEITAQARAAAAADSQVDTVFEIGGQDSKYISLVAGQVADFQMNKVCAAGTGSFVEEQAARLGIALPDYGSLALSAEHPVELGERCTVFMETAINAALAKGATKSEVAAGLCLSVVRNYLHKVVNAKPVGQRIVLQGGVAYNPAIVAAFRAYAGESLTVSPWFAVSGAVGAALLAAESQGVLEPVQNGESADEQGEELDTGAMSNQHAPRQANVRSNFKGWDLSGASHETRHIDPAEIAANRAFFHKVDEMFLEGYDPTRDPAKKTVGIPRCLMLHKLFPMANAFFKQLGFNVVLTDASDEETVRLAQASAQGETCYPVKLVHGHMAQLLDMDVDYVFMPSVHTIRHLKSTVPHNYACTYMQSIPAIVASELDYEGHGITLLNPLMNLDFGQGAMAEVMLQVGAQLGRTPQETARAMLAGGFAVTEFTRKTEELGDQLLAGLKPGERVIVLITRNYGIVDPALNMGIPDMLLDRGWKVITVSHLHAHDLGISADYPGVVWPFGQHILSGAKLVRRDPRLFAVYLTNHGCGPDTMISHLFAEEMGSKPYLHIEMDEHYSKVGVETRVEAFLNAIEHYEAADLRGTPTSWRVVNSACEPLREGELAGLPSFGPYGPLAAQWLRDQGIPVRELAPTPATLELGRKECTSKEYYSFASLLGVSLAAAVDVGAAARLEGGAQACGEGAGAVDGPYAERDAAAAAVASAEGGWRVGQLLLPSSQGGEADGQFDRVIRSVLDAKGHGDVRVVAPDVELLPCNVADLEGLFVHVLAGDVVWAAAPAARPALQEAFAKPHLTLEDVLTAASAARESWQDVPVAPRKTLALVGEWPLVVGDELTGGLFARLEGEGYRAMRAPFAEYLLFVWEDGCDEARHGKVVGGLMPMLGETGAPRVVGLPDVPASQPESDRDQALTLSDVQALAAGCEAACAHALGGCDGSHEHAAAQPQLATGPLEVSTAVETDPLFGVEQRTLPQDEWRALLGRLAGMMQQVADALGDMSAYASDHSQLRQIATDVLGQFAGANARYRYAKAVQAGQRADGVVAVASMYENVDIMLRLKSVPCQAPLLHLAFDGALDQSVEERLRSFLYYV
ncbi:acyl-CoA dehydratase activase [uncultured Senegalimassilia sp.]|uniref:acyl-CoA dehydratase activase n=1 Tax=uncultured Senegalimassilia sp. TaxID=1714350 RepID=UPI0025CDDE42|nr:acyl-CoA dehydratase activase [uncultured Senegalimassilia sp.]